MPTRQACVLAAGKGTRMGGDRPKVLFQAGGRTLLEWVLGALSDAGVDDCVVVVGFQKEEVIAQLPTGVRWAGQSPQLGTGHAVRCARSSFPESAPEMFVTYGDMPLVTPGTYHKLAEVRRQRGAAAVMMTVPITPDSRFGRVIRDKDGNVARVVEYKDANDQERSVLEGNAGIYCFDPSALWPALELVKNDNAQGEYYLPDVIPVLLGWGKVVAIMTAPDPQEALGVNTPEDLAIVERVLTERKRS